VSQAHDNSAFRISYTNTSLNGYLPNSSQYKNTFSVTGNMMSKDKKFNVFTAVNFFNNRTKGRQDTGYGDNNIMVKFTQWGQRQLNIDEQKGPLPVSRRHQARGTAPASTTPRLSITTTCIGAAI
jgi:hypothetical protein